MNKKILMIIILLIIFLGIRFGVRGNLEISKPTIPTPILTVPQAPKTFKFDRSTDLKLELEKINPEVLDSDFE